MAQETKYHKNWFELSCYLFQDTSLSFIRDGMYDELVTLLSPDEFAPLKPLVLLLGWNYVYSCDSANNLLDALHEPSKVRTGFNRSADFLSFF